MTTARQRAANRRNALLSTGPRSRAGRRRSAANATRHGLDTRPSTDEVRAATASALALLGCTAASLSEGERVAADGLARAAIFRARVREAEQAYLAAFDTENPLEGYGRAAADRQITRILTAFLDEGVEPRIVKALGRAAQPQTEELALLLRYRNRAENGWRRALRQWAEASRLDAAPDRADENRSARLSDLQNEAKFA